MQLSDFDYDLPADLIAKFPAAERRGSRLLEVARDGVNDRRFAELPAVLREGDLLVFNDTRVIPARLYGEKSTGGRVEILIERVDEGSRALTMLRASKTLKAGAQIRTRGGHTAGFAENSWSSLALIQRSPPSARRRTKRPRPSSPAAHRGRSPGPPAGPAVHNGEKRRPSSLTSTMNRSLLSPCTYAASIGITAPRSNVA